MTTNDDDHYEEDDDDVSDRGDHDDCSGDNI